MTVGIGLTDGLDEWGGGGEWYCRFDLRERAYMSAQALKAEKLDIPILIWITFAYSSARSNV